MRAALPSPYLRDRVADMPAFRDRIRPLPMTPKARCSHATAAMLTPAHPDASGPRLPIFGAVVPLGFIEVVLDDSIADGTMEIDGTRVAMADIVALQDARQVP